MLNPWLQPSQMDPFNEMSAENAFRDSMQLTRQDSLEDALQFIYRDQTNLRQNLTEQSHPPVQELHNNLDFERTLADLSDYDLMNLPEPLNNDFGHDEFNKEKDSLTDLIPAAVNSPLEPSQEQAVPATTADLDERPATHMLYPGIRTPVPLNRDVKTERGTKALNWSSSPRPTRPQSVAVHRIKQEPDAFSSRDSSTPDPFFSADGSRQIALPKPRKYERKPEPEKCSTTYQAKRAKNNDAVRRSRAKAKDRQNEVEERVAHLETENQHLRSELKKRDSEIKVLKTAMEAMTPAAKRRRC